MANNLFPLATIGGAAMNALLLSNLLKNRNGNNNPNQPVTGYGTASAYATPHTLLPQGPQMTPQGMQTIMSPNAPQSAYPGMGQLMQNAGIAQGTTQLPGGMPPTPPMAGQPQQMQPKTLMASPNAYLGGVQGQPFGQTSDMNGALAQILMGQ